jgi:PKD repeat protein
MSAGTAPLLVTFDGCTSTGQNLRFGWDFDGDGVEDARDICRVQHVYPAGTFTASGTMRGAVAGGGSHTQTWQIVVSPS